MEVELLLVVLLDAVVERLKPPDVDGFGMAKAWSLTDTVRGYGLSKRPRPRIYA